MQFKEFLESEGGEDVRDAVIAKLWSHTKLLYRYTVVTACVALFMYIFTIFAVRYLLAALA